MAGVVPLAGLNDARIANAMPSPWAYKKGRRVLRNRLLTEEQRAKLAQIPPLPPVVTSFVTNRAPLGATPEREMPPVQTAAQRREFLLSAVGCSIALNDLNLLAPGALVARRTKKAMRLLALCIRTHHEPGTEGLRALDMKWDKRSQVDLSLLREALTRASGGRVEIKGSENFARLSVPIFLDASLLALAKVCFVGLDEKLLEAARA